MPVRPAIGHFTRPEHIYIGYYYWVLCLIITICTRKNPEAILSDFRSTANQYPKLRHLATMSQSRP